MKDLVPVVEVNSTYTDTAEHSEDPKVGRWYWYDESRKPRKPNQKKQDFGEPWLGCITHLGSNYAQLVGVRENDGTKKTRVHFRLFWTCCVFEPSPDNIIDGQVKQRQIRVNQLMASVVEITRRLSISPNMHALPNANGGGETQALATVGSTQPIDSYKKSLVKAKETQLPELFAQIKQEHQNLAHWMSAKLIPLKAQASSLEPVIGAIENRLFSVELYAGLTETVEQIKTGDPAELGEKIHLFQRRCYMDEECLAQYETGGMTFKQLKDFDVWLKRPSNLDRLLPFPRCIVAFRVRRHAKYRTVDSIGSFLQMLEDQKWDESTFLYIRNGQQLFRLNTEIEFDEDLFPDLEHQVINTGKVWAKLYDWGHLISDNQYQGLKEEHKTNMAEWLALPKKKRGFPFGARQPHKEYRDYVQFSQNTVFHDDIAEALAKRAAKHNRLVLVLQGLLDRSPVLHPHPAWSLWSDGGFGEAMTLIYDKSKAIPAGDPPDFADYKKSLDRVIRVGSVTLGQQRVWEAAESEKDRHGHRVRPYGNEGPGKLAHVVQIHKKSRKCSYQWTRKRIKEDGEIGCKYSVHVEYLFNVSAYKPGDFKRFFNDPRTRADYLKWAPMMLEAEEFHAGNRKVAPVKPLPPRRTTGEGAYQYQKRKRDKALVGAAVRLRYDVTTKGGKHYKKGSLFRVVYLHRGGFTIQGITKDGKFEDPKGDWEAKRSVRAMQFHDLEIDLRIPPEPKEVKVEEPKPEKVEEPEPEEVEDDEDVVVDEEDDDDDQID